MGLFKGDKDKHRQEVAAFLFEGEDLIQTYGLLIDFAILTNYRLLFVDKTWVSKRAEIISVPYHKIEDVRIQKDRTFSVTNRITVMTKIEPHKLKFLRGTDVMDFYHHLCAYTFVG